MLITCADWDEHNLLAERLKNATCKWILSSYDIPEMYALFPDNFIMAVQSVSGMRTDKNNSARITNRKVLITNFAPPAHLVTRQSDVPSHQTALQLEDTVEYHTEKGRHLALINSPSDYQSPANRITSMASRFGSGST